MFPRVTHPSAAPHRSEALDLHVLSLPPTFVLSHDQTLKFDIDFCRRNARFDEDTTCHYALRSAKVIWCSLIETYTHRSLVWSIFRSIRKDLAVHVSLSSSSHCQRTDPHTNGINVKIITLNQQQQSISPDKPGNKIAAQFRKHSIKPISLISAPGL